MGGRGNEEKIDKKSSSYRENGQLKKKDIFWRYPGDNDMEKKGTSQ